MDSTLPAQARVVVVGGGIVGCSLAYHLARLGWHDIVVLEQGPLFQNWGSTSHAPGLMFQHHVSRTVCQLAQWSAATYREVDSSADPAVYQVGSLEVAETAARWQELKRRVGQARAWGLEAELIGPDELRRLVPFLRSDDLYGAFSVPSDCAVKTVALCEALAARAGERGATFYAETPVTGIALQESRVRAVETPRGRIATEIPAPAAAGSRACHWRTSSKRRVALARNAALARSRRSCSRSRPPVRCARRVPTRVAGTPARKPPPAAAREFGVHLPPPPLCAVYRVVCRGGDRRPRPGGACPGRWRLLSWCRREQ